MDGIENFDYGNNNRQIKYYVPWKLFVNNNVTLIFLRFLFGSWIFNFDGTLLWKAQFMFGHPYDYGW